MLEPGVFHVSELEARGITRSQLQAAVINGSLTRIRRGWYASPGAPIDLVTATRQRARLTCVSAAKLYGIWTPIHDKIHVFSVHGRSESISTSLVTHPLPYLRQWPDNGPVAPLELALLHAGRCLPVPEAAILFESAINQGKILLADALVIIDELPYQRRESLSRINPLAQSGTETLVRWFLESRQVRVQAQVKIRGVGCVDILVGKSLVIECDSVAYHTGTEQYYKDRYRDQELIRQGYMPVHLTWEDVCLRWESTQVLLEGILATRRHRYLRPN